MTYTEYETRRVALTEDRSRIYAKIKENQAAYLKTSLYLRGDKVRVIHGDNKATICFIYQVKVPYDGEPGFRYEFYKMKKDGKAGQVSAGIYGHQSIELIEKALV